jgi:hypothetical protein
MPTISISMDDEAYDICRSLPKQGRSSAISAAIKIWHRHLTSAEYMKEFQKEMKE